VLKSVKTAGNMQCNKAAAISKLQRCGHWHRSMGGQRDMSPLFFVFCPPYFFRGRHFWYTD